MAVYSTEITSESISSDNPIHQRLLMPYEMVKSLVYGDLLEVGCGEGRGVSMLESIVGSYTAIDKIGEVIRSLCEQYPDSNWIHSQVPPFLEIADNQFDSVISFQVIEHIKNDRLFLEEIYRVLKPGGKAFLTTPNRLKSLSRNPWHIREYTGDELKELASGIFDTTQIEGITGSEKVWEYYDRNKKSVEKIMRWDILDLQNRLPASILRIPYEILNRFNRNKLESTNDSLVSSISTSDYILSNSPDDSLDLFATLTKEGN